jgi:hypothetical protein
VSSPELDQYAADVRRRHAASPPTVRAERRRIAKRAAGDLAKDLPGIDDAQLGAVLLRVAAFAHNLAQAQPGATVGNVAGLLEAAGEWLYHHPAEAPKCELDDE